MEIEKYWIEEAVIRGHLTQEEAEKVFHEKYPNADLY